MTDRPLGLPLSNCTMWHMKSLFQYYHLKNFTLTLSISSTASFGSIGRNGCDPGRGRYIRM